MDNADYLDVALRLANASLADLADLRAALHDEPWWADRTTEADLAALRTVATTLRQALDAAVNDNADAVLTTVNTLLTTHPPRPRLSGHSSGETPNWHIHVAEPDAPPAQEIAAAAAWGLAQAVVRHGLDRWGHCAAQDCATYFVDTSTNRAKRFCSARCANRVHVAAFRARQRT
ncbi:CGNR zinc finger domain-containing protein [Crossiella cryophila]|uniref:Putative RNA-binding Zn ribbon-like protein n=1 Tax=Crossiella cryophila TaxID=43355 RepID=A0A7W7FWV1_9PSEU|nr:CGNR zinc finger domain-containing protein [Crossiella cryophila]MBB4681906.1 putative RNA-binding Zn ribbon-like protein [Crossiella cryophila]